MQLKVGELAKRTRISVRTLHHYDEIGLLSPSERSEAGHRLYTDADIIRLQQVISLRSLAFSLEQIRDFLNAPGTSPLEILNMHLEKLQEELVARRKLIGNLEKIALGLRDGQNPTIDELLNLIEGTTMIEKYYSQERLDELKERATMFGESKIREVEQEWATLIQQVRAEMEKGSDPETEEVLMLAKRWQGLLDLFTGANPGIAQSLKTMYQQEGPSKASRGALDEALCRYIDTALAKLGRDQNH